MNKEQNTTTAYYNRNALRWASQKTNSFHHEMQFRKFVRYFRDKDKILDIGCAYGIHIPLFLGIGRKLQYEGIDTSKQMIKLSKARYPQLSFQIADISDNKTISKRKYDGFWAAAVLMHIPERLWDTTLSNIEKITKSGAVGYITLPDKRPSPATKKDQRYFNLFTPKKFKAMIEPRGWRILNSGKLDGSSRKNIWHWFIVKLP